MLNDTGITTSHPLTSVKKSGNLNIGGGLCMKVKEFTDLWSLINTLILPEG